MTYALGSDAPGAFAMVPAALAAKPDKKGTAGLNCSFFIRSNSRVLDLYSERKIECRKAPLQLMLSRTAHLQIQPNYVQIDIDPFESLSVNKVD
jgi:hypothetical protein